MRIYNRITTPASAEAVHIPARKATQVYISGPVACVAIMDLGGGHSVALPLGNLDGLVEFETRKDWTLQPAKPSTTPKFYAQAPDLVQPQRDAVSYTSLDMPRPISEIEKMMRMQQLQIDKLTKAAQNVPDNKVPASPPKSADPATTSPAATEPEATEGEGGPVSAASSSAPVA